MTNNVCRISKITMLAVTLIETKKQITNFEIQFLSLTVLMQCVSEAVDIILVYKLINFS